jgi:hypothetical protein
MTASPSGPRRLETRLRPPPAVGSPPTFTRTTLSTFHQFRSDRFFSDCGTPRVGIAAPELTEKPDHLRSRWHARESKSDLDGEMATLLAPLLGTDDVGIISGGTWAQFEKQVLAFLPHGERLKRLCLLPTRGTKFYRFDGAWKKLYSEDFTAAEKRTIIGALDRFSN